MDTHRHADMKSLSILKNLFLFLLSMLFIGGGTVLLFYTFTPLPDVEIQNIDSKQSIILEDRNGEFLYDFSRNEKRTYSPIGDISPNIIHATVAIEDHLFFEHNGVRLDAFLRALVNNILTLSFSQGGSTITQQVIKNVFLTTEKKIERKLKEFLLAWKIEKILDKEKILELYLNTIPYGGVIYGVTEASKSFFGKEPSEVTIAEAAYLAAIPNAPTYFSPYGSNKAALEKRKNTVLSMMYDHTLITKDEYVSAVRESVYFREQTHTSIHAPHFVFFVREKLEDIYGTNLRVLDGKKIRTTLDTELQKEIEESIYEFSSRFEEKYNGKNIASVVLRVKTGEILAMVGSKDFFDDEIDGRVNVITSLRQPGSTFKPIAYAEAFKKGLRPETVVYDVPTQFAGNCDEDMFESTESGCYSPVNYTGTFVGPISLRSALARSINIPAVKVLYLAGVPDVVNLAKRMGITSLVEDAYHYGLSLVLGGAEVTPLEMAQAYTVFANDGVFVPYRWNTEYDEENTVRVIGEDVARDITDILSDDDARSPIFGSNSALNIPNTQVAAKTGTTNNSRDVWVIGYSPDIVVLVWGGNSDGTVLESDASGFSLAPLFRDIMLKSAARYANRRSYFPGNTSPRRHVPDIVSGKINTDDPHTILHYIQKTDTLTTKTDDPESNPQYTNWEFGVRNWITHAGTGAFPDGERNDGSAIRPASEIFSVRHPDPDAELPPRGVITVIATNIRQKNTQYEFYVNNTLIGSSYIPLLSFDITNIPRNETDTVSIRVVANSSVGVFSTEEIYTVKKDGE